MSVIGLCVAMACAASHEPLHAALHIEAAPASVLIERRGGTQLVNCDLILTNESEDRVRISEIEVSVFDSTGHLTLRKTINANGLEPSIALVAPHLLGAKATIDLFNPFFSYDGDLPLNHLRFTIRYVVENTVADSVRNRSRMPFDADGEGHVDVYPRLYVDRTPLTLPLAGQLLVWDGHDFFSHHRRIPLRPNDNRYAIDLIAVDSEGRAYTGTPYDKTHWFTYGRPIVSPGAGRVIAYANAIPENWFEGTRLRSPDLPDSIVALGNFVVIDHGDGEYSVFPHMQPGSVRVKTGDMVASGQILGLVGFSGDAIFPHVHYTLVNAAHLASAEGLPIYFQHFRRREGSTWTPEDHASVDSGDLIEP